MKDTSSLQGFFYQEIILIWENFCQLHKELFDLTCQEYLTLLESDIDKLESMLPIKEEIIERINEVENDRADLIERLNQAAIFKNPISRAGELIEAFSEWDKNAGIPALKNLNDLLIDIVKKLQDQNKKNQQFLNKAMLSLRDVKQGFSGKKQYMTYGSNGLTRSLSR